jgi:hypothetical protein
MVFDNRGTAVQIGSASPLICADNTIRDTLQVDRNTKPALMFDNSVAKNTQVDSNTGPVDVVGNTVGGTLQCLSNSMVVMGSGNTANKKQGLDVINSCCCTSWSSGTVAMTSATKRSSGRS